MSGGDRVDLGLELGGSVLVRPGPPPPVVAGARDKGVVCLWNLADGRLLHDPLPGHPDRIRSMTALPLPDGRVLLVTGGDTGTIALWDPVTGQPVREPTVNWLGGVSGMCAATVPDGRTLLVTTTPEARSGCGILPRVSLSGASTPMAVRSSRSPPSRSLPAIR